MARLEDLTRGAAVQGIVPEGLVTVVDVKWHGSTVVELTYKDASGRLGSELLYRDREPTIEIASVGLPWSFDGDGALLRLVSEGNTNRQIAAALVVSEHTIRRHVQNVFAKVGVSSRAAATAFAYQHHLI